MKKFIVYDTETGGLDPQQTSLLTATFRVADAQMQTLDQLSLKIKPDDGIFKVTPGAMKINKIDLVAHAEQAITYKEARPKLMSFLNRHSDGGVNKLTPVGHNVSFDDGFIQTYILNKLEWEVYVSYRKLDTATIQEFLKFCNMIPGSVSGSLGTIAQFFGVSEVGAHNADVDVNMTTNVLKAMKQRVSL